MPYRIDLFAIFIFLGVVQALFLSLFFFSKESRQKQSNVFHGLMLLSIAACLFEIFLMYSGYIIKVLHLVDFSEPHALLIGPFFYLFVLASAKGNVKKSTIWIHMAFPIIYTLVLIPFLISSTDIKYNAWIESYHPEMEYRPVYLSFDPRVIFLSQSHTQLVLISLAFYVGLSGIVIRKAFKNKANNFWSPESSVLRMMRDGVLLLGTFLFLIILVKIFFEKDTGDHLFAVFGSLTIYITSFSVIKNSAFFKQVPLTENSKYKNSTLESEEAERLSENILKMMVEQKPFLQSDFSLPKLAQQCRSSVHVVSQVINEKFGKTFFEWVAVYRVEEAKKILKESPHLKIEEVAESVGYSSKSSFNTVFKKITGKTPSDFRSS